jgi:thymidylate synthase ThyX
MIKRDLPGSKLFLIDDIAPEDLAMLQALYSRSAESVEVHLEKVAKIGSARFCQQYFVGYNHKSIADCGTTTMFIEGVSTLAAKAVQDWPLYSGQETSTRYIDMSTRRIEDPIGSPKSKEILARWMEFYTSSQAAVEATIRQRYPATEADNKDEKTQRRYDGAVKARVFDSLRGFLPAGITTQLSWHTNLRQAGDHLNLLVKHPSKEIRTIGEGLWKLFSEQYEASSGDFGAAVSSVTGGAEARDAWERKMVEKHTYNFDPTSWQRPGELSGDPYGVGSPRMFDTTLHEGRLQYYLEDLQTRPRGSVLPHFMTDLGQLTFAFHLDFGSFRDIQRHRNGVCRMPLLTTENLFERWYLEQLPENLLTTAVNLIESLIKEIHAVTDDPVARQYYIPLGFRVPCQVTYGLPAALYVMELRAGKTIHPTLRRKIHWMIEEFRKRYPQIPVHADMDPDDWTVRRGQQTIVAKEQAAV